MSGKKTKNVKASIKQLLVTSTIKVKFGLNKIIWYRYIKFISFRICANKVFRQFMDVLLCL
jgi:hypothetical protein